MYVWIFLPLKEINFYGSVAFGFSLRDHNVNGMKYEQTKNLIKKGQMAGLTEVTD